MSRLAIREQLQMLAARMQSARQCQKIYPPKHPRLELAITELHEELQDMFVDDEPLRVAYSDREFVLGNSQVVVAGEVLLEFASLLESHGLEKLVFLPAVGQDEIKALLTILALDPEEVEAEGGIEEMVEKAQIVNIEAGAITVDPGIVPDPETLFRTWETYSAGLQMMRGIKSLAREQGQFCDVEEVHQLAFDLTAIAIQETRPLLAVHSLMKHDNYSFTHSLNVAFLSLALAQNLPFPPEELREITIAALLHDIGKERIPGEILRKPGKLNDEEWEIMNRHGLEGALMLAGAEGISDLAPLVAYEHHLDHQPDQREDDWEPHLVSQLISIADVYDALRSIRPYRGEIPPDKAMRIMEEDSGTKFEPSLFAGFRAMVGFYPPGTTTRLESGRIAVSFATNPKAPDRPQVMVVRETDGTDLDEGLPLNLASPNAGDFIAEVVSAADVDIDPVAYL